MNKVSYSAHISNGKSAINSKGRLSGVAKHNLRKYRSKEYDRENIVLLFGRADGNVAGCGYHFGSADNDNSLAFLSSQKCGGPAGGLFKQAYILLLPVILPARETICR